MPIYEYFCRNCEGKFEVLRPMGKAQTLEMCPEGHPGAVKVLSVFATVTSGGGTVDACAFDSADSMGCGACGSETPGACNLN